MFNFFKQDPLKKLDKQYRQLLEEARDLQRKGDINGYAQKTAGGIFEIHRRPLILFTFPIHTFTPPRTPLCRPPHTFAPSFHH